MHLVLQVRFVLHGFMVLVRLVLQTGLLLLQKRHLVLQRVRLLLQIFKHKKRSRSAYRFLLFFCNRKRTLFN